MTNLFVDKRKMINVTIIYCFFNINSSQMKLGIFNTKCCRKKIFLGQKSNKFVTNEMYTKANMFVAAETLLWAY